MLGILHSFIDCRTYRNHSGRVFEVTGNDACCENDFTGPRRKHRNGCVRKRKSWICNLDMIQIGLSSVRYLETVGYNRSTKASDSFFRNIRDATIPPVISSVDWKMFSTSAIDSDWNIPLLSMKILASY